ncbi:MAG: iron ABC transporter ATP-binding protein [Candidatus Wallbacteria bacterium HGW-Wallbacteria-1]|jgi:iron complex transport system ATP-binding protein|uniref:Iron ABC transporter ATP-binding protein n=1 Tax=Candidatus Wallbacteria bacterium HGW-Wallbacteria-1 TaxID=2013854 RepID=A0A2N1PLB7_9BACT|nr:MAG: iron ABC transporter ATP-binding protein [Candidatus Wallbacteria bacterium HGW-Wallbacteria-1]
MEISLFIENLTFGYSTGSFAGLADGCQVRPVIESIDLEVKPGEIMAIMGPNGAGKSTLINCLAGNLCPWEGKIMVGDQDLTGAAPSVRSRFMAMVPQQHESCFPFSCLEFIALGRAPYISFFGHPGKEDMDRASSAAELLGISSLGNRPCSCLSGGEMRLALIARALVQDTPIIVLDEPDNHLDFRNQSLVLERVRTLAIEKGLAILMSLHNPNLVSLYCDTLVALNSSGRVMAHGPVEMTLTADVMKSIYEMEVRVITEGKMKFFLPEERVSA